MSKSATPSSDPVHGAINLVSLILIILAGITGYQLMGWVGALVFAGVATLVMTLIEALIGGIRRLIRPLPPR